MPIEVEDGFCHDCFDSSTRRFEHEHEHEHEYEYEYEHEHEHGTLSTEH